MDSRLLDPDADTFILADGTSLWNLDPRLTKALKKALQISKPTLVQSQVIPLVLEGKDVLVRSKTGSGKTLAFLLPLVQKILSSKLASSSSSGSERTSAVILVPTKDLCFQVEDTLRKLLHYCTSSVSFCNLAALRDVKTCTADVCISTPGRLCELLRFDADLFKNEIDTLVVDECDLILQFGCEQDVRTICSRISRTCQGVLCSATLDNDLVQTLKKIVLNNPVTIKLKDEAGGSGEGGGDEGGDNGNTSAADASIKQWYLPAATAKDKDLVLFSLLKLGLVVGKTLFFVNTIDRGYSLKLFFEQFGLRAGVLNAQLPINSRKHILDSYEAGLFDYLIATDEAAGTGEEGGGGEDFGVARGVDFKLVQTVINVDLPRSYESYLHRIGRTGRNGASGTAISLVVTSSAENTQVLQWIRETQPRCAQDGEQQPKLLPLNMKELEGFRYRVEGMRNSIKPKAVKAARVKDLQREILNSDALQTHFQDNPRDMQLLKHDAPAKTVAVQGHLTASAVPSYLLPPSNAALLDDQSALPSINESQHGNKDVRFMNHDKRKKALKRAASASTRPGGKAAGGGSSGKKRKRLDPLF